MDFLTVASRVVKELHDRKSPFEWTSDSVLYGRDDAWRPTLVPKIKNGRVALQGDCDDFAWVALDRCFRLGVPLDALSMVYCNVVPDNGGSHRDGAHLVGMIGGFGGNGPTYVLDCNIQRPYSPNEWASVYRYAGAKVYWRDYHKLSWRRNVWRKIKMNPKD